MHTQNAPWCERTEILSAFLSQNQNEQEPRCSVEGKEMLVLPHFRTGNRRGKKKRGTAAAAPEMPAEMAMVLQCSVLEDVEFDLLDWNGNGIKIAPTAPVLLSGIKKRNAEMMREQSREKSPISRLTCRHVSSPLCVSLSVSLYV
jgi:hypothetical protein